MSRNIVMSDKEQHLTTEAKATASPPHEEGNWEGEALFAKQLFAWEMAKNNYDALKQVKEKEVFVNGCRYKIQFNPARIVSSGSQGGCEVHPRAQMLWDLDDAPRATLVIEAKDKKDAMILFGTVYEAMELKPGEEEPMLNVLAWMEADKWIICIFPRDKHRSTCYTAQEEANILVSPASVDMGGVFITPLEKDFEKITAEDIATILSEVCLNSVNLQSLIERIKGRL